MFVALLHFIFHDQTQMEYAITFRCVDPGTLTHVEVKNFDGRNWESSFDKTDIGSLSKVQKSAN
jgi:hypothetical protein